jgi:phosphatidylinositol alpha-mannosyltransferase
VLAPSSKAGLSQDGSGFIRMGRPFPIPAHGSVARITVSLHLNNRIKRSIRDSRFDVLHLHEPLMPVLPVTALRHSDTFNVGTFHAFARSNLGYYYGKPLLKRYVRKLDVRIAVSAAARNFVQQYFPGDYRIIPNGIDVNVFSQARPIPDLRDGMVNLLFVGRLENRKGLGFLLRAFEQLKPAHRNLRLIIVGDGPLRRWYSTFVARKQLADVVMPGYVSGEEKARYYASSDIFCAPNTGDESFGIVLLEAMASGRPIVGTDIDGFRTVVTPGREGILVERKSKRQLAAAIKTLIEDPELRDEMGRNGQRTVQRYDWQHVIEELLSVYRSAQPVKEVGAGLRLEPSLSST